MIIISIDRLDLIEVRDLLEKIETLAGTDLDEFYIQKIIGHSGTGKNPKKWKFRVHWLGYEPEDDTMSSSQGPNSPPEFRMN